MERGGGGSVIDKGKEGERWRQIKKKESMKDAEKKRERESDKITKVSRELWKFQLSHSRTIYIHLIYVILRYS